MKYKINSDSPAYLQIYMQIRADITNGVYKYGEKLPSKRLLSAETGTSVITAEHAYGILSDEGYIEPKQRSGYYVIYKEKDSFPVSRIHSIRASNRKPLHSAKEEFSFPIFAKTVRRVLVEYDGELFEKSPNCGCAELQNAISKYLVRSRGIDVEPRQIIIGAGAEYLYSLIVQLLGRDKIYAIENPSYEKIKNVYEANGVKIDLLGMAEDGIKSDELEKTDAGILHVTPFNSFPSGITATASKRREYVNWVQSREGMIIEDDFDSEFSISTKTEDTIFSLDPEHTIYLNTFSKTIAQSVRMGYMVLPKNLLTLFEKRAGFYSCTVSAFEQYIIAEIIENGDFERHINKVRRQRRKNSGIY